MHYDVNYEMLRIRMIEKRIADKYPEGKMRCPVHLSIGQEAPAVGVCAALRPRDKMVSTHRGHAHYLAKGGSLKGLIGELYGKSSGCSRGNGGSMHLIDMSVNFWGSTSIVGGTIPIGVGLAFADRLQGNDATTVVCIGDAAIEEGVFHEAANFASLHKLKVIFACENNNYSCYTHIDNRQPNRELKDVAKAHQMPHLLAKDNDVIDIRKQVELAHAWMGPVFVEMPTFRFLQHCGPSNDDDLGYRTKSEIRYWNEIDPLANKTYPTEEVERIDREIDEAFADAESAPLPDSDEMGAYVYATL